MLSVIVPPGTEVPEDMTTEELKSTLYTLGDHPAIQLVLPSASTWRSNGEYDEHPQFELSSALRFYRTKLRMCFNIEVIYDEITAGELNWVAFFADVLMTNALHDAGVDFGMHQHVSYANTSVKILGYSFLSSACVNWEFGMMKKAIAWGAFQEASVVWSAYKCLITPRADGAQALAMLSLLIDECGLDVNFNPLVCDDEDLKHASTAFGEGNTFLSIAVLSGNELAVRLLLKRGAFVDNIKSVVTGGLAWGDTPLKNGVSKASFVQTDMRPIYLTILDVLLRAGASMRVRTRADETRDEAINNNALSLAVKCTAVDDEVLLSVLVKLLHVGKPDASIVEEAIKHADDMSDEVPIGLRLLEDYLHGKPICCDVCEAPRCSDGGALKLCACRTISYCSKQCQLKAWKEHKLICGSKADGTSEALVKKRAHRKKNNKL
jgi:hypothetical protein